MDSSHRVKQAKLNFCRNFNYPQNLKIRILPLNEFCQKFLLQQLLHTAVGTQQLECTQVPWLTKALHSKTFYGGWHVKMGHIVLVSVHDGEATGPAV